MSLVWLDGELVDRAAAAVPVDDRGLTLGDGLFETVRVYGGRPFRLAEHLNRLRRGAQRLGIPVPDGLGTAVPAVLAANGAGEAALRVTLTRGSGPAGLAPPESARPTILVTTTSFDAPAWWYERGLAAITAGGRLNERGLTAGLKTLGYADAIAALREARAAGAGDALRLDTAGHLAAGSASNLFVVHDDTLVTPPESCGILPGITRATVLELAGSAGLRTVEAPIEPETVRAAKEVFLTSSLREIVPVTRLDGRPIGTGAPGPATLRLLGLYRALARESG